ncbi:hypothetical protein [Litoribrevibacter albus]|uniref:Uncharacterized protein n=1 Tax=Litoribrevibacter albus TaxID=1473156 RepID=A0AA37W836_9GAMM|nr:hypothetical protein [Litoribrevibacter albus]GLQ33312.1 hypothetical protein GCM10007876_37920 [Litoribrevibacter albus]
MIEELLKMMISGTVGNYTYDRLKSLLSSPPKSDDEHAPPAPDSSHDPDIKGIYGANIVYNNNYRTFDIVNDLYDVIDLVKSPMVHIVIEDKPSTAWHLPLVVVEDMETKEWYVFSKGRMAFEGSGGGLANSKDLLQFLINNDIRFAGWVLDFISSEKLSQGCKTWPSLRDSCLPLISYNKNQYFSKYVANVFGELSTPNK